MPRANDHAGLHRENYSFIKTDFWNNIPTAASSASSTGVASGGGASSAQFTVNMNATEVVVDRALSDIAVTVGNVIEDSLALNMISVSFSSNSGAENTCDVPCFLSAEEALELTSPFHHAVVGGTIALIRVLAVGAYAVEHASTTCYELYKDIKTRKLQLADLIKTKDQAIRLWILMQIVADKVTDSTTEMYMFCVHDEIDEMWAISEQWDIVKIGPLLAKWRSRSYVEVTSSGLELVPVDGESVLEIVQLANRMRAAYWRCSDAETIVLQILLDEWKRNNYTVWVSSILSQNDVLTLLDRVFNESDDCIQPYRARVQNSDPVLARQFLPIMKTPILFMSSI